MTTFEWDITETLPLDLSSGAGGQGGLFTVTVEDFDIAVGDLPFLMYAGSEHPYERDTAPWQKDQVDQAREVGEQSLTGWWLRSQANFHGGDGIRFIEPLLGPGSETRFRDSRGVDVFSEPGEVTLLPEMVERRSLSATNVEVVASGTRVLIRDGGTLEVWNGSTFSTVTGTSNAEGLDYTGSVFLVGHSIAISTLGADSGTSLTALWTNAPDPVKPFWLKGRIFAAAGRSIYELTMAGGDMSGETPLYTHPDPNWEWVGITETSGAVWAAGRSGVRSDVHVITIGDDGETPALTGATVKIQLPTGETINAIRGYLNFLILATSEGVRVALTEGNQAALGPLVFRDEAAHSLFAYGDYVWAGLANGLTRKIDLGNEIGGDLLFAWANDLEGDGIIRSMTWFNDELVLAGGAGGLFTPGVNRVESGYLTTGFTRFATLENKHIQNVMVSANATLGSITVAVGSDDPLMQVVTLQAFNGSRDVGLTPLNQLAQRVSLRFALNRSATNPTAGPVFRSYQLRAFPSPGRRMRLIRLPLMCFDVEEDRWGNRLGGPGFAWERLRRLERAENSSIPRVYQDFRTGETRTVVIERVSLVNTDSPDKSEVNFGGTIYLTLRTVD
jgi:hypothetical protein